LRLRGGGGAGVTLSVVLRILTSVNGEVEAELVRGRLTDAGIHSTSQRSGAGLGARWGLGGSFDVYVEEQDLDRAREALNVEQISEEELAREAERAGPPPPD
jgi:Putative prokaryotic signal transducing protein